MRSPRAQTKAIREAVFLRAKNRCECGCGRWITFESGHMDHFLGRASSRATKGGRRTNQTPRRGYGASPGTVESMATPLNAESNAQQFATA